MSINSIRSVFSVVKQAKLKNRGHGVGSMARVLSKMTKTFRTAQIVWVINCQSTFEDIGGEVQCLNRISKPSISIIEGIDQHLKIAISDGLGNKS